jgi:hypothetical protein
MAIVVVMLKVMMPMMLLVRSWNLQSMVFAVGFSGFYLHFAPVIFALAKNDDIKKRHNTIKKLGKLIDVQEYMAH